jgi:hypothetical protein
MEESTGYIISVKNPTSKDSVACLVITPKHKDKAKVKEKMERNLGREKAIQIAYKLLECCNADHRLLKQIETMTADKKKPIKP